MATNIAVREKTSSSITIATYYEGSASVKYCLMYCNGAHFKTVTHASTTKQWLIEGNVATGLSPNTQYRFHAIFRSAGYVDIETTSTIYETTLQEKPPTPSSVSIDSITQTSLRANWSTTPRADRYLLYLNGSYQTRTTSTSYTFSGLSPNTTYTVCVQAENDAGISASRCATGTTLNISRPPAPSYVNTSNATTSGFNVNWGSSSGATNYEVFIDGIYYGATSNTSMAITGLASNTTYTVAVQAYNSAGTSDKTYGSGTTLYVDTERPEIWNVVAAQIKSGDNYNIKVTWQSSDNIGVVKHWAYRSRANTVEYVPIGVELLGSARSYTFTTDPNGNPFTAGNRYHFMIRAIDAAGNQSLQDDGKVYIDVTAGRPTEWEWEFEISQGSSFYSQVGKTAYLMRAVHWNNFTARINEFRVYRGLNNYPFTDVSSNTKGVGVTTAINHAINAINEIGFAMPNVLPNEKIKASTFTTMRNRLNAVV